MRPASPISTLPVAAGSKVHVDDFTIDYRPDGSVAQFYSTLSVKDPDVSSSRPLLPNPLSRTFSYMDPSCPSM